jgi:diacylglycerol kinase family enzyme
VVGKGIPLGVLALGTLNHFARDLGIPVELPEAVRVIVEGFTRDLDVGEVNGEVFVNNSNLGFYPPVVRARDWQRRAHNHGKWRATISALIKILPHCPMLHLRIRSDDVDVRRDTRVLFIGNNEYEMSAFNFGARERFGSGHLYLYIARTPSRLGLVYLGLLSLVRDVLDTDHFERFALPELTIETRKKKALAVYLDGEVVLLRPPLQYRVRPRELRVLLPRDSSPEE